jgi:hypothetical protein
MNKLTNAQKQMLSNAIYIYFTKLYDETIEQEEQEPGKILLFGPNWYLQERDEILRKLKLD